jgi:hypothetical protein
VSGVIIIVSNLLRRELAMMSFVVVDFGKKAVGVKHICKLCCTGQPLGATILLCIQSWLPPTIQPSSPQMVKKGLTALYQMIPKVVNSLLPGSPLASWQKSLHFVP